MIMKSTYKYIILGLVCLAAALIQGGIFPINQIITMFIPYLAFCICSFITVKNKNKLFSISMILLSNLVVLPVFNFIYSFITALIVPEVPYVFVGIVIEFVHKCIYFTIFILVNSLINKEKNVIGKGTYILIALFILVSSVSASIHGILLTNALNQAIQQGTLLDYLSAMNTGVYAQLISSISFYLALFFISMQFVRNTQDA